MVKEFVKFIKQGNVIDLAVGVIIGAAFGKIISSLVNDIVTPLISLLTGNIDLKNMFIALNGEYYPSLDAAAAQAATVNYGLFITYCIDFLITGFAIFILIKMIMAIKKKALRIEDKPATKKCGFCCSEINADAVRCPNCTSDLSSKEETEQ